MNEKLLTDYIERVFPFTRYIFERFPWLMQFINFSLVGVINTFLSYIIYATLVHFNVHHQIANQAAFWPTVLNAYLLNRFFVFKKQAGEHKLSQPVKFFMLYGSNLFIAAGMLYLCVDILHFNKYVVPFISMCITVPLNYCMNKFWVFKD